MKIGENIASSRMKVNLTQDQLAEKLGVSRQTISKLESDLAYPELPKVAKLSKILNISCDELLLDENNDKIPEIKTNENGYTVDWTKLYPILKEYGEKVNCEEYEKIFRDLLSHTKEIYKFSLEDAVLVLKDIMYKTYLKMDKEEKTNKLNKKPEV